MQLQEISRPHDLLARRILRDIELMCDLLLIYTQKEADKRIIDLLNLKHLECKSPIEIDEQLMEGIGDLRFTASFKGSKRKSNVFLLFEHQSSIDSDFRLRGLDYIVKSFKEFREQTKGKEKLPYPIVLVLYHGTKPWDHMPEMDELIEIVPGVETGLLKYTLILIDISVLKRDEFKGHPVVQALLEALQLASEKRLVQEFDRVIDRLVLVKDDPRAGGWLRSFCRYAMSVGRIGVRIGTEQITKAFSRILTEKEADDMTKTIAEQLVLEGKAKGKAEGKAEAVLTVLRTRFDKIPKRVEQSIRKISDLSTLDSWTAQATTCRSLDEFAKSLR